MTSSDKEGAGIDRSSAGMSAEQTIFRELQEVLDSSYAVQADSILLRGGRLAALLQGHVESLYLGNTEESSRMKIGDWMLYCRVMHMGSIPEFQDVQWPPSAGCWLQFEARKLVSSHKCFQGVVSNVCEVADRFWSNKLGVHKEDVDPRQLYSAEHPRAMHTVKREHGMAVKQVAAVTMDEARNATCFGDAASVRGVAMCAALTIGTLMGGRRPRTLTAIRLKDVNLFVGRVELDGLSVCVPCISITFREEKYHIMMMTSRDRERVLMCLTQKGMLDLHVARFQGVFSVFDPMRHAKAGGTLSIRPECLEYFLFCDVKANFWIDTAPSIVSMIGIWDKILLERMGSQGRGFSAHWSGFVSRTCILAILASKGKELSPGTIAVMIR